MRIAAKLFSNGDIVNWQGNKVKVITYCGACDGKHSYIVEMAGSQFTVYEHELIK